MYYSNIFFCLDEDEKQPQQVNNKYPTNVRVVFKIRRPRLNITIEEMEKKTQPVFKPYYFLRTFFPRYLFDYIVFLK